MSARKLDIGLHDTTINILGDDANDPTMKSEIFGGIIRLMRRRGWTAAADQQILKHHRCISSSYRLGRRGTLRCSIQICGRNVEIEFWAETWPLSNPNGQRYDFDKRERLDYLDRLRVDLETRKIIEWLSGCAAVSIKPSRSAIVGERRVDVTAEEYIRRAYAAGWHSDKVLGRPVCNQPSNWKSRDGGKIEHGARVWFIGGDGRIRRGTAYYNINNMWWVVENRFRLHNIAAFEIFAAAPENLRRKRNERQRRDRLERLIASAVRASDFGRAALLKRVAFGDAATYGIWSSKEGRHCYYRANYSGYTSDAIAAGRYTWDEAVAEVRRVPHLLSIAMPDGSRLTAADLDRREAA